MIRRMVKIIDTRGRQLEASVGELKLRRPRGEGK
jgi:hypothetical protein